ncbi:hypothetical protein CK203_060543 [Vitis vinifera]|uniref:RNase H type-1 domain-containing protein n=1 Tax=Vitis vinifera TaxID=29760 RepID=A0A438GDU8_VITVI|nr:hypothetical protein CK203_060543 [Vitis vinifera]
MPLLWSLLRTIVFDDLIDSHVGIVEGASDFVDPPLSFDVLSGFVSRSDIVSDVSSMDLSIFEYLPVSCDIDLSAPSSPTSQIFDIDDEIAQHDSDDDSSSVSDSDPVDQRVSPAVGDTEIVDFGTADQPRELRIGSDLSTDERTASSSCSEHIWTSLHEVETIAPSLELAGERGDSEATQCGFLSVVEYPEWLANVVPVPKKDGKSHAIRIEERRSHISESSDHLFHDMMHRDVEVYVDDMIVKSRGRSDHLAALGERGIEVDPDKIRAILTCLHRGQRERPALVGRLMRWLVLLTEFDIHYVTQKSIRGSIVADHLASLPVSDARAIDDDFPDEDVAAVTSLSGWRMYFDDLFVWHSRIDIRPRTTLLSMRLILGLETALELGIRQMEVFGDSNLVLRQIQGEWKTRDVKLRPYMHLELLVARFEDLRYTHLPRAQNQFADALATLASMIDIPADATVRPLLIESRSAPAYCCLIDDMEIDDGLPWYHDIYHFLRLGVYPEAATAKDRRALRQLATRFVICGETLYRRSPDGMLLCLDRALPIE